MPDTTIPFDTLSNQSIDGGGEPMLTGAQMRDLWSVYEAARDAYSEADEERTGAAVSDAQLRTLAARTVDPEGNAIKLKIIAERADRSPGLLGSIIEDLSLPRRAPSLVDLAKTIADAARPHVEEGGGVTSRADLVDALAPLIGHYTIADAVRMIGFLRTASAVFSEDGCDDALFVVDSILEDFASLGEASDADSAAARAHLIEKSSEDDAWDLGTANLQAATRHAASDMRTMQKGNFRTNCFGGTFVSDILMPGWLYHAIQNSEGNEASSEYAASIHAARAQAYEQQQAAD